jgi:hypothetical protein
MSEPIFSDWRFSLLEQRFNESGIPLGATDETTKQIADLILDIADLPLNESTNLLMDITNPERQVDSLYKQAAQICLEVLAAEQSSESY